MKPAAQTRDKAISLYKAAAEIALTKGIIIADTKFEFGLDKNGTVVLMDEVLTPDSSRYWPLESYIVGHNPPSFDKQFLRDWRGSLIARHLMELEYLRKRGRLANALIGFLWETILATHLLNFKVLEMAREYRR